MRKKIPVIFFLLCILLFLIYKFSYKAKNSTLLLGEIELLDILKNNNYENMNTFFYDNITYRELLKEIKNNSKKIIKGKEIYLNQLISSSNTILIYANNAEYNNKCKKNNNILSNYNDILENDINNIILEIKKMSKAKIIVIGNHCNNKHYNQNISIKETYIPYQSVNNFLISSMYN